MDDEEIVKCQTDANCISTIKSLSGISEGDQCTDVAKFVERTAKGSSVVRGRRDAGFTETTL